MITRATIKWEVSVTIDDQHAHVKELRELLITQAIQELIGVRPKITNCIERPEVNDN